MTRHLRSASAFLLTGAAALLATAATSQAAVTLTGTAVFNSGTNMYLYSYSVTNTGTVEDIALITVPVDPAADIMGISAPSGFELTFDPSQGWLNFNEDSSIITDGTFAPGTTVGSFEFTSPFGPVTVTFTAFDASGTEFTGTTVTPSSVPEPSAFLLFGMAAGLPLLSRRRRTPASL